MSLQIIFYKISTVMAASWFYYEITLILILET